MATMPRNISSLRPLAVKVFATGEQLLHLVELPRDQALYVSERFHGGRALLLAMDDSGLFASPTMSFTEHLEAFRLGQRSPMEFTPQLEAAK